MVEQRNKIQEISGSDGWSVSVVGVKELLNGQEEPIERSQALGMLAAQYDINHSWLAQLEEALLDKKIIKREKVLINGKGRKALSIESMCYIGLVAQGLIDQKLIYSSTPKRSVAIREMIEVIRKEGEKLC